MPPPASLLGKRVAEKQITIEFDQNSIMNPAGNDDNDFLPADKLEAKSSKPVAQQLFKKSPQLVSDQFADW